MCAARAPHALGSSGRQAGRLLLLALLLFHFASERAFASQMRAREQQKRAGQHFGLAAASKPPGRQSGSETARARVHSAERTNERMNERASERTNCCQPLSALWRAHKPKSNGAGHGATNNNNNNFCSLQAAAALQQARKLQLAACQPASQSSSARSLTFAIPNCWKSRAALALHKQRCSLSLSIFLAEQRAVAEPSGKLCSLCATPS